MTKPKILVTAAAGKTGAPVVEQLLERGFPVRAMIRRRDERSARLEKLGAELVVADFLDLQSMRAAVEDVQRVYFCYPPEVPGLVEATAILATAARDAGVEAVVNMSQITAREHAPSPLSRQHWLSEGILDRAGVGAVHVLPTFFAEMLSILGAESIATDGVLYLPYGNERHAPVSGADIARVVVGLLADPAPHTGERYVVTGPRDLTIAEMAEVLSDELGRPVEYVDLPMEHWLQALRARGDLSEFLIEHFEAIAQDHRDGVFSGETDVVERIGGQAPETLAQFVRGNRGLFGAEVASHA